MGRPHRNFEPGEFYLVCHIGNKNFPVYLDPEDNEHALGLLLKVSGRYHVRVHCYAQLYNQGLWLLEPSTPEGISNVMRDMQGGHSRYLNRKYSHRPWMATGQPCTLPAGASDSIATSCNWGARFAAFRINRDCYDVICLFTESRPAEMGLCSNAAEFPWSSAPARIAGFCARKLLTLASENRPPEEWTAELNRPLPSQVCATIQTAIRKGTAITRLAFVRSAPIPSAPDPVHPEFRAEKAKHQLVFGGAFAVEPGVNRAESFGT